MLNMRFGGDLLSDSTSIYSVKTSENQISDVFRGYRDGLI